MLSVSSIVMICKETDNIEDGLSSYKQQKLMQQRSELLSLNNKQIRDWVNNNEGVFSERQIYESLRLWFNKHVKHDWTFDQLYSGMTLSQIVCDLSFDS